MLRRISDHIEPMDIAPELDHHGQPHLEVDERFDSIEEAWLFAIHWQQQQGDRPATERLREVPGIGPVRLSWGSSLGQGSTGP
jgi:hypothetical protein